MRPKSHKDKDYKNPGPGYNNLYKSTYETTKYNYLTGKPTSKIGN